MARRGRPPKPTTIAFLTGDPGKRRRYQIEPAPPEGIPDKPDHIAKDVVASAKWDETIPLLQDMGVLSSADGTALGMFCEAWSRYRKATEKVEKYGDTLVSSTKYVYISPYVHLQKQALKDCHTFLTEFGLTPSARARLAVKPTTEAASTKWAGLVG
jgi:P27 family predicted phage terminase small subunit